MSTLTLAATTLVTLALLLTALSLHVSRLRLRYRQTWGDGGYKDLATAIRTHGNTLEQSMLFGLLLLAHAQLPSATLGALALLIRRELFMRPHRRHACLQSTF